MNPIEILLVEDEPDYQYLIQRTLQEEGWKVIVAGSAEEALDLMLRRAPALAIVDINLPGMDGYDLCKRLRNEEAWAKVPVLMLTVRRRPNEWLNGFAHGATDYLSKPFNPPELIERVKSSLEGKTAIHAGPDNPEHQLIDAIVSGNRSGFAVLMEQYKEPLINCLIKAGAKKEEASEVLSTAFANAWEHLPKFRKESSFFTWVYAIAHNALRKTWIKSNVIPLDALTARDEHSVADHRELSLMEDVDLEFMGEQNPEKATQEARLHEALKSVPGPYRRALKLHYLRGLPYEAVSRKLKMPTGTVMSRISRGKDHLRRAWVELNRDNV